MSEPLLNVMKVMLLAGLYLFFVRVLWSVFNELRDPRTVARRRPAQASAGSAPASAAAAPLSPAAPAGVGAQLNRPLANEPSYLGVPDSRGSAVVAAPGLGAMLVIVEPADRQGMQYRLGAELTVGRAATNGVQLDDTYVSTVHARIFATDAGYFVEDLASRNGTILNGEQLTATTALTAGDRLTIGATTLEFSTGLAVR